MDDRLKQLMQELGNAINESLSESEAIAAAIGEIKAAGYDVFLVLEATIGFNKREGQEEESPNSKSERMLSPDSPIDPQNILLTPDDNDLLKKMRISFLDPNDPPDPHKK